MADFKQAMKWMEEGHKVRIKSWRNPNYFWWVDTNYTFDNLWCIVEGENKQEAVMIRSWVESEDWEMFISLGDKE